MTDNVDDHGDGPSPAVDPAAETDWARRAAFHYLERYATSAANLARVLRRKQRRRRERRGEPLPAGADDDAPIEAAVERCRALGLIDDKVFAEGRVASGRRRGLSGSRIAAGLAAKGVDRETVSAAVAGEGTDERTAVLRLARRRRFGPWRTRHADDPREASRKEVMSLCRAGFPPALARWAVGLDPDEAEVLLAGADQAG